MDHTADLELALRLADAADAITVRRFRASDLRVAAKPDLTPVTDADTAVEDMIRRELAATRPGDAVLGEERGGSAGAHRAWILDPVDGTKNFTRGVPAWATLIALAVDGRPVLGVVSAPALRRRWWAGAGGGAWPRDMDGAVRRIGVSAVARLAGAYLSTTDLASFLAAGTVERYLELVRRCWTSRAFGDFWQHVLVAEGVLDLAVDAEGELWDLAAVQVIVTEAGGRFTDLAGVPRPDRGSALASNGLLHDAALRILAPGAEGSAPSSGHPISELEVGIVADTIPTANISTSAARRIIMAAEEKAAQIETPMVIAVCDTGGVLKAFSRMDGAQLIAVQVAQDKAYTAVGFGLSTEEWHDFVEGDEQLRPGARTGIHRLVTFAGGFPIKVGGAVVGGLGVSGGHWSQDADVAKAGLAVLD